MNSFKLSMMNLKQNIKNYALYLFAMIFSVVVFYNFVSIYCSKEFSSNMDAHLVAQGASMSASMILILFFIFFINYSSKFFIDRRKKEFGIYTFMGIENSKIALIFAGEGLLVGILSLGIGLIIGIITNKVFLMALTKVAMLDNVIKFTINSKALIETSIIFFVILIVVFIKEYLLIVKSSTIELINYSKIDEKIPKKSYVLGILGILLLLLSYFQIINANKLKIDMNCAIIIAVVGTIISTYLVFYGFFPLVIQSIIKNKKILYKGVNIISYSNIIFRIKNNYKTLAAVTILVTSAMTAFGTVYSQKYFMKQNYRTEVPYAVSYLSNDENEDKKINEVIEENNKKLYENKFEILFKDNINKTENSMVIGRYSDLKNGIEKLEIKTAKSNLKYKLNDDECIFLWRPGVTMSLAEPLRKINIGNEELNVITEMSSPFLGSIVNSSVILINDEKYDEIKSDYNKAYYHGVMLENFNDTEKITNDLLSLGEQAFYTEMGNFPFYTSYIADATKYDFSSTVYFIGSFLAIVFVISIGSIMHFKCLGDADMDKIKYDSLQKMGLNEEELKKSVYKQVGIFFVLPVLLGTIHSLVAIKVLSDIMKCNIIIPTILTVVLFLIIYILFYVFTSKKYIKVQLRK